MKEDDKVMEKEQNELSENLNHWDYIDRYSRWMYHTYQAYINDGDRIFDVEMCIRDSGNIGYGLSLYSCICIACYHSCGVWEKTWQL